MLAIVTSSQLTDSYQLLSECCSERLDTYRKWVGVATLRSFEMTGIPEDFTIEPLNCECIRIHPAHSRLILYAKLSSSGCYTVCAHFLSRAPSMLRHTATRLLCSVKSL